jgi:hypothetical protein
MKIKGLLLLILLALNIPFIGCGGPPAGVNAAPGQEFTLATGQQANITGENFTITFKEVIEDSRCPKNVTCIWEGRVSAILEIEGGGASGQTVLSAPGLSTGLFVQQYRSYQLTFQVNPYPEAGKTIGKNDYRLFLKVDKK